MKKIILLFFLFPLLAQTAGCSSLTFVGGHFITNFRKVHIPEYGKPPSPPQGSGKCYSHQGRAGNCLFPYHFARIAGGSTLLMLVFFPISVAIDVAFSPIAFFWGAESGAEHWFESDSPPPVKEEPPKENSKEKKKKGPEK